MKRLAVLAVVACLCGCALAGTGRAESITYTETFKASGTLGTKTFTDAMVTIIGTGNTSKVFQFPGSANFFNPVTATVTIAGIGKANMTDSITADDSPDFFPARAEFDDQAVGFDATLITSNNFFASYDLTTSIAPPVSGSFSSNSSSIGLGTDQGTLTFTSFGSTSTFGATTSTATPEPASLTLLGIGAAGLLGYGWRRRRRRLPAAAP